MTAHEVLARIKSNGIIPVIRASKANLAEKAVDALIKGGLAVVEITLTVPDAPGLIASTAKRAEDDVLVGAGSVTTAEEALRCIEAGAQFIVSPGLNLDMVRAVKARGIAMIAGALTPTEVMAAHAAGADLVKVFPCSALGGEKYLRALRGPLPHIELVPTGGVNVQTVGAFVRAGAVAVGVGSDLVDVAALERGDEHVVVESARELLGALIKARSATASDN